MTSAIEPDICAALRDEARKWVANAYANGHAGGRGREADGIDRDVWRQLADLGWLGLMVPESHGGAGAGAAEFAAIAEAVGAGAVREPVTMTAGTVVRLLGAVANRTQADADLSAIAKGALVASLAHAEPAGGYARDAIETTATADAGSVILNGAKAAATVADIVFLTARDPDGTLAVWRLPGDTPGVAVRAFRMIDGRTAADLTLSNVRVPASARMTDDGDAAALLDTVLDTAALFAAAEIVGAMETLLADTAAYLTTREQFGVPLARFQALQHRLVDMYVRTEEARAALTVALSMLDTPERVAAVAVARSVAGRAANGVAREAVQLHGGMGMTDELRVGHLLKRCLVAASSYGDADWYRNRFAETSHGRID